MKNLIVVSLIVSCAFLSGGCSSGGSQLSKDESQQMDKLFREGIKNPQPPTGTAATENKKPPVMNEPVDK